MPTTPFARRSLLRGSAALLAAPLAAPAVWAQTGPARIRFTLPWLAQGATAYAYIAREMGQFRDRGIDATISRGFGSNAAAQAIAQGQFEFGLVGASSVILNAARGLPLVGLATVNYDMTMGILLRQDSPIRTPKDLEGRRLATVPAGVDAPFLPAYLRLAGVDPARVQMQQVDNRVFERTIVDRQVDAGSGIGSSSIPVMMAQNAPHRFMLFSQVGLQFYANVVTTRPEILARSPDLCERVVDALLDAAAFQLREPEQALDALVRQVPEIAITQVGRDNARLSQGIMQSTMLAPEAIENGLGWTDMGRWARMTDLVMEFGGAENARRPEPESLISNRFAGKVKLTAADWGQVRTRLQPFAALLS
jgi:ABC-type nitrate/sulfonate/bicarbonate transport system substrate-binding protein